MIISLHTYITIIIIKIPAHVSFLYEVTIITISLPYKSNNYSNYKANENGIKHFLHTSQSSFNRARLEGMYIEIKSM